MLDVLGLDPSDPAGFAAAAPTTRSSTRRSTRSSPACWSERAAARADQDWTRADAIRDRIAAAGIEVEDTPDGPKWTVRDARARDARSARPRPPERPLTAWQLQAQGRDPEVVQATDRRVGRPRAAEGSRARGRRRRRPTAPTTRPTSSRTRPSSPRPRAPSVAAPATTSGSPGATRWSRRSRAGVPVSGVYVAEGTERDARLREAFKLAAEGGISLLEVTRAELDRRTDKAVHQGLAARIPAYEYAHPTDLLDAAAERGEAPLIVALDSVTDPRNLGAVVRSAAGVRRPRCRRPRAPGGADDRLGLEVVGRGGRAAAGRPRDEPGADAQGLPGRRLPGGRPRGLGRPDAARPARRRRPGRPARSSWSSAPRATASPAWWARPATGCSRSRWRRPWSRSTPGVAASIALYALAQHR